MIARRLRGENRATKAGQRFHQMGYARHMVQVPTVFERISTGARFREDYYPVTDNQLGWSVQLNVRGAPQQAMSQLHRFSTNGWPAERRNRRSCRVRNAQASSCS